MDDDSLDVVIVARSPSLREDLAGALRDAGLVVVTEVAALGEWQPHGNTAACVVVADVESPAAFGRLPPDVAVLLVGAADTRQAAWLAGSGRRWGALPRGADPREIAGAVAMLVRGLVVLPARLARDLAAGLSGQIDAAGLDPGVADEPLTPRELEVLELVSEGHSNKVVAARLGISEHTVKFHLAAVCGKLGASSRTEAVRVAVRRGLLTL